jgi:hypothetical protein
MVYCVFKLSEEQLGRWELCLLFVHHAQCYRQMVHEADHEIQPPSRLQEILTSPGYIIFIIPDLNPSQELSIATRLAHDLHVYHRLDAEIYGEFEASSVLKGTPQHHGSIVFIGAPSSRLVAEILREKRTAFEIKDSKLLLNGQALNGKEFGTFRYFKSIAG